MTDNNGIPFEVKKPFETVKEIDNKYEVPSFEEFMKTYEADESLNYDDLNYSDISDKGKGYGPCGWDNKDCTCYLPRFVALYLACPATKCNASDKDASLWKHYGCGGRMYIEVDAWLKCMREEGGCGEYGYITDWSFACYHHQGRHWSTSNEDCIEALSVAMKAYKNKSREVKEVVEKIIKEIMRRDLH